MGMIGIISIGSVSSSHVVTYSLDRLALLGAADQAAGAALNDATGLSNDVASTDRTLRRKRYTTLPRKYWYVLGSGWQPQSCLGLYLLTQPATHRWRRFSRRGGHTADHLGDDITRSIDVDPIAHFQSKAPDFINVVQRGITDYNTTNLHRLQLSNGR